MLGRPRCSDALQPEAIEINELSIAVALRTEVRPIGCQTAIGNH